MADSINVSVDDGTLSASLGEAALQIIPEVVRVVGKGALNVKNGMRKDAEASRHFRLAPHIGYDHFTFDPSGLSAQIGPQRRGAAKLANIAYFGGAHGGGGTIRDPQRVADEEAPRFERALLNVIDGIL